MPARPLSAAALSRSIAAAAAAALTVGCGPAGAPKGGPDPSAPFTLSAVELPSGFDEGCDCMTRRLCPIVEQVPGWSEVRNVSCRWIEPESRARCRYETRFVAETPPYDGNRAAAEPGPWGQNEIVGRLLPGGRWCAEEARR